MAVAGALSHTLLSGPPVGAAQPIEEIIRPFTTTGRGIAFVGGGPRLELSYADLAGRVAAAAALLARGGVGPGEIVATTVTNDVGSVVAVLATWARGATVVSLPPATSQSRAWHARQFGPALAAMGCAFLIDDDEPGADAPADTGLRRIGKALLAQAEPGSAVGTEVGMPATALIQFTSGSVGVPKGVAIGTGTLAGHLASVISALELDGNADRIASWLPLYHDFGLIGMFLAGLAARLDVVLARPLDFATQPASWLTMLARERATVTAAPSFGYRLAAAVRYDDSLDLSRMRLALSGGERVDWQTLVDFHATAAPMGLRWEALTPCYGLAEGTVGATRSPLGRGPVRGPDGHVSTGPPIGGVELRVPTGGEPGPIQLRGDWLFGGYHTGAGFEPVAADEWYDTGDAGFSRDGELYVIGRRNEVVAMAGRNIFAEDVESIAHEAGGPLVRACAAFRSQAAAGRLGLMLEINPRLVRTEDAARELARTVQASVTQTLGTRLTPLVVVRIGTIPRTTSGKVQRAQCRSIYDAGEIGRRLIAEMS